MGSRVTFRALKSNDVESHVRQRDQQSCIHADEMHAIRHRMACTHGTHGTHVTLWFHMHTKRGKQKETKSVQITDVLLKTLSPSSCLSLHWYSPCCLSQNQQTRSSSTVRCLHGPRARQLPLPASLHCRAGFYLATFRTGFFSG